jgi:hypothetical protein
MRIIKFPKTISSVRINKLVTDLASGVIALGLTKSCIWNPAVAPARRMLLTASVAILALALGGAPQPASAVECDNIGAGVNNANDIGVASNTACGENAAAASTRSTAIGIDANSGGDSSVAIGDSATTNFAGTIAIGENTTATSVNAIAVGNDGGDANVIGATASGINSLAIGTDATATSNDTVAIGTDSFSGSPGSTAVGRNALAQNPATTAIGDGATAGGAGSAAIGVNTAAFGDRSVALGEGSVANLDNTISVGSLGNERQIANVAPGTADTDAATVGQLEDARDALRAEIRGNNSSSSSGGLFSCSMVGNGANDPTLLFIVLLSVIYLVRKRYLVSKRLS